MYGAVDDVLKQMVDPGKVVWAPSYGAAALQHDSPRPCARSEIYVLGLIGWEPHQHRCESGSIALADLEMQLVAYAATATQIDTKQLLMSCTCCSAL